MGDMQVRPPVGIVSLGDIAFEGRDWTKRAWMT
jgi:hypothetical protein